ncbi:MAG: tRNA glutamyl-Q(34) synthetase GluQRS [Pseudomonadales bacterium]|nr:tRNA glutamyl-Q(34) synthetase GluQRS [Pseudomonadales bacterium]
MKSRKNSWGPELPSATPPGLAYIGRFAPSPSGPLHEGSLITALASYLDARARHGRWLVRMEDLDPPRESPAAAHQILLALEQLGLHWDGDILYQSQRLPAYEAALADLSHRQLTFRCTCTRPQILAHGGIYPGTCRDHDPGTGPAAIRCRVEDVSIHFCDRIQGPQVQNLKQALGDFVIRRKDGLIAYQLAVVVDDAYQRITHIVRGCDLLDSTARQMYLQSLLGFSRPDYAHIPVIVNALGQKLSKQHFASALDTRRPEDLLLKALGYLRQAPDPQLHGSTRAEILTWAVQHWRPEALQGLRQLSELGPSN